MKKPENPQKNTYVWLTLLQPFVSLFIEINLACLTQVRRCFLPVTKKSVIVIGITLIIIHLLSYLTIYNATFSLCIYR